MLWREKIVMGCVIEGKFETGYAVKENFLIDSGDGKKIMKECAIQKKVVIGRATFLKKIEEKLSQPF